MEEETNIVDTTTEVQQTIDEVVDERETVEETDLPQEANEEINEGLRLQQMKTGIETEMEDEEVTSLKQQLEDANRIIQDQKSAILEKTNEVERLQAHIKSIHLDEIIQLYQIQKRENEYLMEEVERVRSLLSNKKQSDADIHKLQEESSQMYSSFSSLINETNELHSAFDHNVSFMEQQYQSFQATSEILLSDLKSKIDTECSSIMEKDEKIMELNNQIESLSYQISCLTNQLTSSEAVIQKQSVELEEFQNKYQILETEFKHYSDIESQKMKTLQQEQSHLREQLEKADEDLGESLRYKVLLHSMLEKVKGEENVDVSSSMESQIIQLKKEKELLLLNIQSITNDLEEKIPLYQHHQKVFTNLNQNYNQLLILWNNFVNASNENDSSDHHEMDLLRVEIQRQKQENESLRRQMESLELLLTQFRQLLIQRGNSGIPEIGSIFEGYQQKISELEKQLKESSEMNETNQQKNQLLRRKMEYLKSTQLSHNDQLVFYSQRIEQLQKRVISLYSQLKTVFRQFDVSKLSQALLLEKYIQLVYSIKQKGVRNEVVQREGDLQKLVEEYSQVMEKVSTAIGKINPVVIEISPPSDETHALEDEILKNASLSKRIDDLVNQKKDLEETMREMEDETNDINNTIDILESKNKRLETENSGLKSSIHQLHQIGKKQFEISPLGNPFDYSSYSLNEELAGLQNANDSLQTNLALEKQEKNTLQSSVLNLQQMMKALQGNEAIWKDCLEAILKGYGSDDFQSVLSQLCISRLSEANLRSSFLNYEKDKEDKEVTVIQLPKESVFEKELSSADSEMTLRNTVSSLEKSIEVLQKEKKAFEEEVINLQKKVNEIEEKNESLQLDINQTTEEVHSLQAENEDLRMQVEQNTTLNEAVSEKRDSDGMLEESPNKVVKLETVDSVQN